MKQIADLGEYDCMDWSDEVFEYNENACAFEPNAMACDERICPHGDYSCGDGQCIEWRYRMAFHQEDSVEIHCFNKRNINYMCEVNGEQRAWTRENGLCEVDEDYDDHRYPSWSKIRSANLSKSQICQYLFRCILSNNFEHDCPCNYIKCIREMRKVCSLEYYVIYPPEGLINANIFVYYEYTKSYQNYHVYDATISGSVKCRGYRYTHEQYWWDMNVLHPLFYGQSNSHHELCKLAEEKQGYTDFNSYFQYDKFCWNDSVTFNGRPYAVTLDIHGPGCTCISQYRIGDGQRDCPDGEDEKNIFERDYCTGNVGRHRFHCFNNEYKCLPLDVFGNDVSECSNNYDEYWYRHGSSFRENFFCRKDSLSDCGHLREYIRQSSIFNSNVNITKVNISSLDVPIWLPFLYYCDSFWQLDNHIDESPSLCQHWVCQDNEYQCQTGQCVPYDWVCDGEWDCSDASDEEAIMIINQWSQHNHRLVDLEKRRSLCRKRYSKSAFSRICNTSFELGCYRSGVANPLNITLHRPCINLTKIGDGIEDCYNAYDEKNTFVENSSWHSMWGFHFRCGSVDEAYPHVCLLENKAKCDKILCSYYHDKEGTCSNVDDVICLHNHVCKRKARCNGKIDCPDGEDEYWCPFGSYLNHFIHRFDKQDSLKHKVEHFFSGLSSSEKESLSHGSNKITTPATTFRNNSHFIKHSYQCQRGIAVTEMGETKCLCPPAYYGHWCEFFSDRISVIVHVDRHTFITRLSNITVKIKVNLFFNNKIIDDHEFNVIPMMSSSRKTKHKFYLVYSRTEPMLLHKRNRYFNRSDIIHYHPYSVGFYAFSLEANGIIQELGSWHYTIYFDYLPAFRLAAVLRFPSWHEDPLGDPCFENTCNERSVCKPVFNRNHSYYCSCKRGFYGKDCQMYEHDCDIHCSMDALCQRNDYYPESRKNNISCICPLGYFGPSCNLKHDGCRSNPCLNNGSCLTIDDAYGRMSYVCNCLGKFYGERCELRKMSISIDLKNLRTMSVDATIVQFSSRDSMNSFKLSIDHQQVFKGLPLTINYDHIHVDPKLGFVKIFEDSMKFRNFIVYLSRTWGEINVTSFPPECPHVLSLLPEGKLSKNIRNNPNTICFLFLRY
jgi:hypothetical protein